jgi:NAD(P)-dependent dehydrogenase (short-subunit alcohol dehydrogenase family)
VGGSGGIGRAVSLELGARGAYVIVHGGSSRERLDSALVELRRTSPGAEGFLLKLGGPNSTISGLVEILAGLGSIDILVVAFGPFVHKSLTETDVADWERIALFDLALPGALCSALLPAMAARGWGRILLFGGSRTDGIRSYSSNAAYAAAKTGLAVLTKSLAAEGSARGVCSVLVCPGLVDTEYLDEPERRTLRARAPGGRLASPDQIADAAVCLIAAEPCLASGAVISLDGGIAI